MTGVGRARRGVLLEVTGIVQGVGFRPFVHRLATSLDLDGWVRNAAGRVEIAIEGDAGSIERFRAALLTDAPPLARIESVRAAPLASPVAPSFRVAASAEPHDAAQPVPADVALCAACEAELRDPDDRRHRYPFIACVDCGPRFSVIEAMPYDRERTTLDAFPLCADCAEEYATPADRRFHAEATACPRCGPRVRLIDREGGILVAEDDGIAAAGALLRQGRIVAVRGVGGFHLAVDATDPAAVARLRARKRREAKPLAVMVRSIDEARTLVELSEPEAAWLTRPERPIVVARALPGCAISAAVSDGLGSIGVMLPYSPLHLLLSEAAGMPLVMTSGNLSSQPLVAGERDARDALGTIADAFLTHDREIANPIDDSVVRLAGDAPILLRRARGFAPIPLAMPVPTAVPLLAVGAHLKNTFTLARDGAAYVSQHIGDLETLETAEHWERMRRRYEALFHVEPRVVVRDRHPEYLSTHIADRLGAERVLTVQHHHAHIAAVAAEHGATGPVVGIALDGVGHGDDGRVWGSEILVSTLTGYERVGHLRYAPLPGGDAASRSAWRSALGYISLDPAAFPAPASCFAGVDPQAVDVVAAQARRGPNAPEASSMGRLFDAAAALLGVCVRSRYEGEAAMRLEAAAGIGGAGLTLPFPVLDEDGAQLLDPLPLLAALFDARVAGLAVSEIAAAFHDAVARALVEAAQRVASGRGLNVVALGGGVFQNARLLDGVCRGLEQRGLRVLCARALPPNDGAISFGQAVVAAARLAADPGAAG